MWNVACQRPNWNNTFGGASTLDKLVYQVARYERSSNRQWNSCARPRETREIDESMPCPCIPRKFRVLASFGRQRARWTHLFDRGAPITRRSHALINERTFPTSFRNLRKLTDSLRSERKRRKREEFAASMKNRCWHRRRRETSLFHDAPLIIELRLASQTALSLSFYPGKKFAVQWRSRWFLSFQKGDLICRFNVNESILRVSVSSLSIFSIYGVGYWKTENLLTIFPNKIIKNLENLRL